MTFKSTLFLALISHTCNATVLIRFGKVPSHYLKNYLKRDSTATDPFEHYELRRRRELCDVAINAKQFAIKYNPRYYGERTGQPQTSFTTWDPLNTVLSRTINYQRSIPTPSDPDPKCLKYQSYYVTTQGEPQYLRANAIQCVNTMNLKWYLTYGWVDNFMYLLETSQSRTAATLLVTGIFEPEAVVANRPPAYFEEHFTTSTVMMEEYCHLGIDDTLRICGTVFDALHRDDNRARKNYMRAYRRFCAFKSVKVSESRRVRTYLIRCTIFNEEEETTPARVTHFYALADSGERYAVFVLSERGQNGLLELEARVTGIGALMNPVGRREEKSRKTRTKRLRKRKDGKKDEAEEELEGRSRNKKTPEPVQEHSRPEMKEPISRGSAGGTKSQNENEKTSRRKEILPIERENEEHSREKMTVRENAKDASTEKRKISDNNEAVIVKGNEKSSRSINTREFASETPTPVDNTTTEDGMEISSGKRPKLKKIEDIYRITDDQGRNRQQRHSPAPKTKKVNI